MPAFARMWRLTAEQLAERPHIETITALCQPLHGDAPTWQALRDVITAIDSRDADCRAGSSAATAAWSTAPPCRCRTAPPW